MFYILEKVLPNNLLPYKYRVISHHYELTQDTIKEYSQKERLGFFNLTQFKKSRWIEMWLESENRVIVVFNDLIEYTTEENINLEKAIREYKPVIRNKRLIELGI